MEAGVLPTTGPASDPERPEFCIDSEERANWLLRKLANLDAEEKRIKAQAAELLTQIKTDRERLTFLFENQLIAFVRDALAAKGNRRKSLTLLQGTCAFRYVPGSIRVYDPSAALQEAQKRHCVKQVETLDAEAYLEAARALFEEQGSLLPGVESVPDKEAFSIRFGKSQ